MLVNHTFRTKLLMLIGGLFFAGSVLANGDEPKGIVEDLSGFNINNNGFLQDLGIRFDGWAAAGIGGNPRGSADGLNGPVTFNDRTNRVTLNQFWLYAEREVNTEGDAWDVGFRADFLYGTDARFTQAKNFLDEKAINAPYYQLAVPQAYIDVFAPIGNGLTARIGHFYTIIGYEVVTAPDNFFFSHAYTMQYGEPFTHTGVLLTYSVNDNVSVTGGVTSGWDAFFQDPPNFLGSVNFSSDDGATSLALALSSGDASQANRHNRTLYSVVLSHDFTENLHWVFQHDLGRETDAVAPGRSASWYGINNYLTYDVNETVGVGARVEWFRDEDGVRVGFGSNSFFAFTGGVNWSPLPWLKVRPEVRYDFTTSAPAFDGGRRKNQILISTDLIVQF